MRPPVYVETSSEEAKRLQVQSSRLQVLPPSKVVLNDYKRAFEKKFGTEGDFLKELGNGLQVKLNEGMPQEGSTLQLSIPSVVVSNESVTTSSTVGSGGPFGPPPSTVFNTTDYCVIRLEYRVTGNDGVVLVEGAVVERTERSEFLHPNQSKLANAVDGVQRHLVNYLRGRMSPDNVAPPDPKAGSKGK